MKTIEELEQLVDKRNEYIVSLYQEKMEQEEQLTQLKDEYEDLQKKMVLNPNTKNKTKLEEKRQELHECEKQFKNTERDIKDFENSVLDIAPYRQDIISEYQQQVKANIDPQLERLKQAKQAYEAEAAKLTEIVRLNNQLRSENLRVLTKSKQDREEIEFTLGEDYFGLNTRNHKINQYIDNEIQRIQAQLHPFMPGNTDRSEIEVKSVFHIDFLGNLI